MNFEPEDTVLRVKQALQEKEGITVEQIRLINGGKPMNDVETLGNLNIQGTYV